MYGYAEFGYFTTLYPTTSEQDFNRHMLRACKIMDDQTSGIDGIAKLKVAMPTDPYDRECVARCCSEIIYSLIEMSHADDMAAYRSDENGVRPALISSISSGSESISFATGSNALSNKYQLAASNKTAANELFTDICNTFLRGVRDANGVKLLYGGPYPYEVEEV